MKSRYKEMKYLFPILLCFSLLQTTCTNKTKVATAEEPISAAANDGLLEGWISLGPRARIFTPCGSAFPVLIETPSKALQTAYDESKGDYLYAPVYVLVEGKMKASRAQPYGQAITITNILASAATGPAKCKQNVPVLVSASGNEPSWKIQIDETKKSIVFTKDFGKEIMNFPYTHPQQWGENWTWLTSDAAGRAVVIKRNRSECKDSMSGQVYSDEVTVEIDGVIYSGCGGKKIR